MWLLTVFYIPWTVQNWISDLVTKVQNYSNQSNTCSVDSGVT